MKQDQIIQQDGDLSITAMDGDNVQELEFAGYCAYFLSQCYPGHPFCVESHQGDIRIRHWALSKFGSYCYYIDPSDMVSPTALHKLLKRGGGEILDRLGLPRDKPWTGEVPKMIDDVDIKWLRDIEDKQPNQGIILQ